MSKKRPTGLKYKIVAKNPSWFTKGFKHSEETKQKMRGRVPWNKDKKGLHLSPSSEFKKGVIPYLKLYPDKAKKGAEHHNWMGDAVSYSALHRWVERQLGKPRHCAICCSEDKKMYHWANISKSYRRDVSDWIRLCVSCHKLLDKGKIKL